MVHQLRLYGFLRLRGCTHLLGHLGLSDVVWHSNATPRRLSINIRGLGVRARGFQPTDGRVDTGIPTSINGVLSICLLRHHTHSDCWIVSLPNEFCGMDDLRPMYVILSEQIFLYFYRFQSRETRCKSNLFPRRVSQLRLVPEMSNADSEIIKYG